MRVCAIAHQKHNSAIAVIRQAVQIGRIAVDRRVVDLKIARMDDRARFRCDCKRACIDNRVRYVDKLDFKIADLIELTLLHGAEVAALGFKAVLFKFIAYHPQGKRRSVDRKLKFFEKIWHRADMILVRVGDNDAFDLVFYLSYIIKIGDQNIHSKHTLLRKAHAHIDDDRTRIGLKNGHIRADLAQSAKRRDTHHLIAAIRVFKRMQALFVDQLILRDRIVHRLLPRLVAREALWHI